MSKRQAMATLNQREHTSKRALAVLNLTPMSHREKHGKLSEMLMPHNHGYRFKDYTKVSQRAGEQVSSEPGLGFYMRGAK